MKIHGLQKMTLLDFPGRVACTVFLGGCDLRCPFCHNYELVDGTAPAVMDDAELLSFLKKRQGLLDGVAITGGEPCLRSDLPELLRQIRALGYAVKLDTNGFHPQLLRQILQEGLVEYVAMDIKNSPAKYSLTAGFAGQDNAVDAGQDAAPAAEKLDTVDARQQDAGDAGQQDAGDAGQHAAAPAAGSSPALDLALLQESIALVMEHAGDTFDYEFRTTVVKELHEAADFEEIGKMIAGARHYFLQSFTDRDSVPFEGFHAPPAEDLRLYAQIMRRYVQDVQIRGVDI